MAVKYGVARLGLQNLLLQFSDTDYQREAWIEVDIDSLPSMSFVGVESAIEAFLEDIDWDDGQELIGIFLRGNTELEACLSLEKLLGDFYVSKGSGLSEKDYLYDSAWPQIIAAARHALRVMNRGDI